MTAKCKIVNVTDRLKAIKVLKYFLTCDLIKAKAALNDGFSFDFFAWDNKVSYLRRILKDVGAELVVESTIASEDEKKLIEEKEIQEKRQRKYDEIQNWISTLGEKEKEYIDFLLAHSGPTA